jgi:hypothetical protein
MLNIQSRGATLDIAEAEGEIGASIELTIRINA